MPKGQFKLGKAHSGKVTSPKSIKSDARFRDHPNVIGGSYMAEHGNWPIFSTEFGKIVYILADFGKQEYCRT